MHQKAAASSGMVASGIRYEMVLVLRNMLAFAIAVFYEVVDPGNLQTLLQYR